MFYWPRPTVPFIPLKYTRKMERKAKKALLKKELALAALEAPGEQAPSSAEGKKEASD